MATIRLKPVANGTGIAWTAVGGGIQAEKVDEGVDTPDDTGSEVTENTNGLDDDNYTMDDTPGDFDVAIDVDLQLRGFQTGRVDDTCLLSAFVVSSDEATVQAAGDAHNVDAVTSYTTFTDASPQANTDSAAAWDGYRIRLRKNKTSSGMPDSVTFTVTAVDVVVNYDVAAAGGSLAAHRPTRRLAHLIGR